MGNAGIMAWVGVVLLSALGCQKGRVERKEPLRESAPAVQVRWIELDRHGYPSPSLPPRADWSGSASIGSEPIPVAALRGSALQILARQSGGQVRSVRYSHTLNCGADACPERFIRERAQYDQETGSWWIPFNPWLEGIETSLSALRPERLELELGFDDGRVLATRLTLPIEGEVPALSAQRLPMNGAPTAEGLARAAATQGWVLARERIANPTARALRLSVRSAGDDSITQKTRLQFREGYCNFSRLEWRDVLPSLSQAAFRLGAPRVVRAGGAVELAPAGEWGVIQLEPGEIVTLEWVAHPASGTPACPLYRERRSFTCDSHLVLSPEFYWWVAATQLQGGFTRELRIGDAGSESSVLWRSAERLAQTEQRGEVGGVVRNYDCQGVFE